MRSLQFCYLPRDQAVEFRDHVIAREPYYLRDLARWMQVTDGPIEAMDASTASLEPLWEWYVEFARRDFDGVTEDLVPSFAPYLAATDGNRRWEQVRQSAVAGDRLIHYVRLVLARLVPGAHWEMYLQPPRGPLEAAHQLTVVFLPGYTYRWRGKTLTRYVDLEPLTRFAASAIDPTSRPDERAPTRLWDWLATYKLPEELRAVRQHRHESVLASYADLALPPIPDIARTTPAIRWQEPSPPRPARTKVAKVRGEYTMAKGPSLGLDDEPWLLSPLPADQVAAALTAGGFIDDEHGDRVDPAALLAGLQIAHADGVASINPFVHDGALRALFIEAVDATPAAWHRALKPLYALAETLGARLAPDEDFD